MPEAYEIAGQAEVGLMTEAQLQAWIRRRLGHPTVDVPLDPEQLSDAVLEAKRWFIAKKGTELQLKIRLYAGQVEYQMPAYVDQVIDVAFEVSPLDISLIFAPNIFAGEQVPYNVFAAPSSTGLYSSFVQALQYVDQAKRVLGTEQNWNYNQYTKKLLLWPAYKDIHQAIVEYKGNNIPAIEQLPERDHDLIKRFALAWAKRDLGQVYAKYPALPGAEGPVQMSITGIRLLEEAKTEFDILTNEITNSALPEPFLFG